MARAKNKLSAAFVRTAPLGFHSDGGGLYLNVHKSGGKSWVFRFALNKKQHDMGLGPVDLVTLAEARDAAEAARKLLLKNINPLHHKNPVSTVYSFQKATDDFLSIHAPSWKDPDTEKNWRQTLGSSYCADILHMDAGAITVQDIQKIIKPIWHDKAVVARRIRKRTERILDVAKASGHIADPWTNPARLAALTLPKKTKMKRGNYRSMPYTMMPDFISQLRAKSANTARLLEFMCYTVVRFAEASKARISEFDFDKKLWTIPKERMKVGKEHIVPLSDRAIELVTQMSRLGHMYVFPGENVDQPLINNGALGLMARMNVPSSPHGIRSTFRTWCDEVARADFAVAEACLSHQVGNATVRAYARSDFLDRRRELMQEWWEYITP